MDYILIIIYSIKNIVQGPWVRQTPEEGRRTYRPKRCENNNKDENNGPKFCLRNLDSQELFVLGLVF